jgi:uncharacterized glyoxalase superfamily metalloenzyme YdcJ
MLAQAQVKAVLTSEARDDGTATLTLELDVIPGAVWQLELQSQLPEGMRVSLFERGGQKFALLTYSDRSDEQARAVFESALQGANDVSREAHSIAASSRRAREQAATGDT